MVLLRHKRKSQRSFCQATGIFAAAKVFEAVEFGWTSAGRWFWMDGPMHDPMTVAFTIKSPFKRGEYRPDLITIWHVDPEKDGTDDSCGWFKRARHGDKKVLESIIKEFERDWDRTWTYDPNADGGAEGDELKRGKVIYPCGLFNPSGMPRYTVQGIVLNLMHIAAANHFDCDGRTGWRKARKFISKRLLDILLFTENPVDSLFDSLTLKHGNDTSREDRIRHFAEIIYGWILREDQPWYRHARWHVHHWKIQIHFLDNLKRWLFSRCCRCGKGFSWGYCPTTSNWNGTGPRWFRSEEGVYHSHCGFDEHGIKQEPKTCTP